MSLITLIRYGLPALAFIGLLIAVDDNGYARGRDAAEKVCREVSVPTAVGVIQQRCDATAKQSKELSHELQSNVNAINARYYSLLKTRCAGIQSGLATKPAGGDDGAPGANEPTWVLSLDERYLNDKQAAQLVSCQDTIAAIYRANGREDLLPESYRSSPGQ